MISHCSGSEKSNTCTQAAGVLESDEVISGGPSPHGSHQRAPTPPDLLFDESTESESDPT